MQWAIIDGGIVRQTFDSEPVLADTIDVRHVDDAVQVGWLLGDDGSLTAPPPLVPNYARAAQEELDCTVKYVLYYFEIGDPLPSEIATYRSALRSIVSSGVLPDDGWPTVPTWPVNV